jgi:hypothetical protein
MIGVGVLGYWSYYDNGIPSRPAIRAMKAVDAEFEGPLWAFTKNATCEHRYPFPEAKKYGWWFCVANKDAPPTVLLLGNSFANHLYPGMIGMMPNESVLSIGACPPLEVDNKLIPFDAATNSSPCAGIRWYDQQQLIDGIVKSAKPKLVIVAGVDPDPSPTKIESLRKRIDFMERHGAKVVVFWPHARPDNDIKGCFARPFKAPQKSCEITLSYRRKIADGFIPVMESIKTTNPTVEFFDPTEAFCSAGKCSFVAEGLPTIRDQYGHYSRQGSRLVAEKFILSLSK